MHSAISVPLESTGGRRGVLTVYRRAKDGFHQDDLRVLLAIRLKVLDWELQPLATTTMLARASGLIQEESVDSKLFNAFM
jgi:hypothetical protein